MIIPVHSNIVSGLYVVIFETILALILGVALQTYIYAYNLNVMHNRKSSIRLTTTRLQSVAGFGITSKKSARLTSLLGCVSLILTVIGSFSIDGASRPATKFVTMPLFVAVAKSTSDFIDFPKHVSTDGLRVSATFILASLAMRCAFENETKIMSYPIVGEFDDFDRIDSLVHPQELRTPNFSCTVEDKRFVGAQPFIDEKFVIEDDKSCMLNTSLNLRNDSLWQENLAISCDGIEIVETWCASFRYFSCSMHVRQGMRHSYMYALKRIAGATPEFYSVKGFILPDLPSQFLKSAAYLMATGTGDIRALQLSRMSIKRNVPVEVEDGEVVLETEVSVPLFLSTAGVVTVGTVVVCLVALLNWRQHVVKRGLRGRNGYNGAMDILMLAAEVGVDEEEVSSKGEVVVGVSGGEPRVGPMLESSIGSNGFDEHSVDGRLRRGKGELVLCVEQVRAEEDLAK